VRHSPGFINRHVGLSFYSAHTCSGPSAYLRLFTVSAVATRTNRAQLLPSTLAALAGTMVLAAGCSSSTHRSTTAQPSPTPPTSASVSATTPRTSTCGAGGAGQNPQGPEVNPPGDIPDNQAYATYRASAGGYSIQVPEGWARAEQGTAVTFTDKFNSAGIELAPPDSVLLLPEQAWHTAFDPLAVARPDLIHSQVHVALDRQLPHDPAAAFTQVTGAAHHLEGTLAGAGLVGNNIGAALDAPRKDALYAQVLFLFLGFPGAVLAGLLTIAVAAAGSGRRRRELALLRVRGATATRMTALAGSEAAAVAAGGGLISLIGAVAVSRLAFSSTTFGASTASAMVWSAGAVVVGGLIAAAALVVPVWRDAQLPTVAAARQAVGRPGRPWARAGLDLWLLLAAGLVFWLTSRSGYQLVLVPEGVPSVSVNYWALAGPALLWIGAGLLAWRMADGLFGRGHRVTRALSGPLAGGLGGPVTATMARQRRRLAWAVALVALTGALALSTAVFNSTYRQQAEAGARLTNGADVTVSAPPNTPLTASDAARLAGVSGVRRVEPLLHRFGHVGADLQDLYGVRPGTIGPATRLQDAGVVREFPTAPKDSVFVANASYLGQRSANPTRTPISSTPARPHLDWSRIESNGCSAPPRRSPTSRTAAKTSVPASLRSISGALPRWSWASPCRWRPPPPGWSSRSS
jgi:hypothetical protein